MNDIMKTILDGMQVGFAEMKKDIGEMKTDIREMKTDISEMKTDIGEMRTDIGEMRTDIGEMGTDISKMTADISKMTADIGEMRTDIGEMRIDIGEMRTDIGEMKTGFIRLQEKVDRIDNRTGFLVDHNDQHFVEDRHSHQGALHVDTCTLDVIVASLLFRKTSYRSVPSKIECDLTSKQDKITNTMAEWCIQRESLASFFEILHTIYNDSDCNDVDYQDPKNMMALLEHITKLNDENKKPQDDDGEMDRGVEPVLQVVKKLVKMFNLDPKGNLANKKISVCEYNHHALWETSR